MNAPATITPPQESLALPFNLVRYGEGEFERMHAAGAMMASASQVAAIFGKVPQRCGPLAYAMHLTGEQALPDIGDEPIIKAGHLLEPLAADMLADEVGHEMVEYDAYSPHPELKLFATPDRYTWFEVNGVPHIVELKMCTPRAYYEHWQDGPPIWYGLQHQAQFACTGAKAGIIAALNTGYMSLDYWFTEPKPATIARIEDGVGKFMTDLKAGKYPDPDEGEIDAQAFRDLHWQSNPGKAVRIKGGEAIKRFQRYDQAKLDEAAVTATIKADKMWFQRLMKNAETAKLDDGSEITWKTNKSKAKGQDRPNRIFKHKAKRGTDDE